MGAAGPVLMISEPLRLLHCSPVSDGAAAVLLCPADQADRYTDQPVQIIGSGLATSSMSLAESLSAAGREGFLGIWFLRFVEFENS